jgi:DNA repair protein RadC
MSAALRPLPAPLPPLPPLARSDGLTAVRSALARLGPRALGDDELLALLLGGADPLATARAALAERSGLAGLARADLSDLLPLGSRRATALVAAVELGRRTAGAWPDGRWQVRTPADLAERLLPQMGHLEREELRVLLLNTKNAVTAMLTVYAGNLAGSSVRVGEVFRDAVRRQAAALVVAHNHPSGDPSPSAEDLRITAELSQAGRLLDIELLDHLVIGHGRWVSLRSLGAL